MVGIVALRLAHELLNNGMRREEFEEWLKAMIKINKMKSTN